MAEDDEREQHEVDVQMLKVALERLGDGRRDSTTGGFQRPAVMTIPRTRHQPNSATFANRPQGGPLVERQAECASRANGVGRR